MKKAILTIAAFCFAIAMAFGQQQIEVLLSDDRPSEERTIEGLYGKNLCIFSFRKGEADTQGNTPVYIKLENIADDYLILLFNQALGKKELRNYRIYFAENFSGESVHKVEKIDDIYHNITIPTENGMYTYRFPEIIIKEGQQHECLVPIHVAKEKKRFLCSKKKKIIESVFDIPIKITVEESDKDYPSLKRQCDSLCEVFHNAIIHHDFCTNKLHRPSFEEQIQQYKNAKDDLRLQINLAKNNWKPESSKYQNYVALVNALDDMDAAIEEYKESKYDCGDKTQHKTVHSCKYCKLSLEEIYNLLDRHYRNLYNRKVEKKEIWKDVSMLYKCCTDATCAKHASQWRKGGLIKDKIIERYNQIKDFQ